jgi:dipeptidyl aminopeptidase/acylaminoacyl peptidase
MPNERSLTRPELRRLLLGTFTGAVACLLVLGPGARPAQAAFPGQNGRIAFATISYWEESNVVVMNADGSGLVDLTGCCADEWAPAFSPDGSRIAFTSNRTGDAEIYVMDADGTDVRRVTSSPAQDFDPAFSADGATIVFASDRDGNRELYVIGADVSGETRVTSSAANEEDPAFSADGSRLAFTSDRDGNREVYVAAADGAAPLRLTFDPAADYQPGFSPDGSRIAFTSERGGGLGRIHVMGVDGSAPTLLSSSDTSADHDPSFSPDGTKVVFAGDFVCPPVGGCAAIMRAWVFLTGSDGLSGRTAVGELSWVADLDWGVATPVSPRPDPTPVPVPDTTPPETQLTSGPSGPTNDSTPTFAFSGSDDVSAAGQLQYSTRLGHGEWSAYTSATNVTLALGDGQHIIAVRARDEAGNEDPTPAQRSFTIDTLAPSGTVVIEDGATRTRQLNVTLTFSANDPAPASGVTSMRISNTSSGLASAMWTPYTTTQQWTLSAAAGTKTVYVQYRDAAGNVSAVAQDSIRYRP